MSDKIRTRSSYSAARLLASVVAVVVMTSLEACAQDFWTLSPSQSGDWSNGTNWSTGVPTSSDTVYVVNGGTATVTQLGTTCGTLSLGGSGSGTVEMTGGSLSVVPGNEYLGNNGAGTFNQSGGTNSISTTNGGLYVGYNAASAGSYNLNGAGVLTATYECVGYSGTGTFTQSSGTNYAHSTGLCLGYNAASSGSYSLNGSGVLNAVSESVGLFGAGAFTQSGGTNNTQGLNIGRNASSSGTYILSDSGLVNVISENVANAAGTAAFIQSGGTNSLYGSGALILGGVNAGGTYNLSGSGVLLSTSPEYVGGGSGGTGTFTQTGGTNSITKGAGGLYLGSGANSSGIYNLSGSGVLTGFNEYVGDSGSGMFIQTAGTNSISSNGGMLFLGYGSGSSGTYNLNGPSLLSASSEYVGRFGTGTFTQSGGTNSTNNLLIGPYGNSIYNLNGGALVVASMSTSSTAAAFNFSGGTLQASSSFNTTSPMTLGTSGGGATFDTAGFVVTLSGSLSGPGSLTKLDSGTLTLAAANTYTGNTLVYGGTLSLAHQLAVQNSTVSMSSSGTLGFAAGNTSPILGGLAGIGSVGLATVASEPVTLNVGGSGQSTTYGGNLSGPGGLAKLGAGTLALSGFNTYTGPTLINAGTLKLVGQTVTGEQTLSLTGWNQDLIIGKNESSPTTSTSVVSWNFYEAGYGASTQGLPADSGATPRTFTSSYNPNVSFRFAGYAGKNAILGSGTLSLVTPAKYQSIQILDTYQSNNGVGTPWSATLNFTDGSSTTSSPVTSLDWTKTGQPGTCLTNYGLQNTNGSFYNGYLYMAEQDVILSPADQAKVLQSITFNGGGGNLMIFAVSGSGGNVLPATTSLTISANATLDLNGGNQQVASLSGNSSSSGGSIINSNTGSASILTLSPTGGSTTFSGTIQGGGTLGAISLRISGSGTQVLAGSNSCTGDTAVNAGTLQLSNVNAAVNSTVSVNVPNGLIFAVNNLSIGGLAGSGAMALSNGPNPVSLTVGSNGTNTVYSGALGGAGSLTKIGSGTLTLSGSNSYLGGTGINAGTLLCSNAAALGSGPLTLNGGTLQTTIAGNNASPAIPNNIQINLVAGNVLSAPTSFNLPLSGNLMGPGTVTKTGAFTVLLSGSNEGFTGTYINAASNTFFQNPRAGSANASWLLNDGNLANISPGSQAISLGALSGSGGQLGNNVTGSQIAYSIGALNSNTTYSGNIIDSIGGGGTTAVVKTGSGTLTLSGNNTYSGGTTIDAGTLVAGGGALSSGRVNVAFGSTLSVNGGAAAGLAAIYFPMTTAQSGNLGNVQSAFATGLPAVQTLLNGNTVSLTTNAAKLNMNNGGATFPTINGGYYFEAYYSGMININSPGTYTFARNATDDDAAIFVDGQTVVVGYPTASGSPWGMNGAGTITLNPGMHDIVVAYYQAWGGSSLDAQISGPNNTAMVDIGATGSPQITPDLVVGSLSGSGNVSLSEGNLITGFDNTNTTFGGTISGIGGLTKFGGGMLTLTTSNTFSGKTTISGGTLNLAHPLAAQGSTVNVNSSGGLRFSAGITSPTLGGLAGAGNIALVTAAAEPVALSVGQNGQNTTYSGNLIGAGGLTKVGIDTLTISASQSYSGPTVVRAGMLRLQGTALALPTGTVAYYTFSNPANLGFDSSGNSNNLTTGAGNPAWASGRFGTGALSLDGQSNLIPSSGAINGLPIGNSAYTIAAWMYLAGAGNDGIVGWGNYGTNNQVNAFRTNGPNQLDNYWWGDDLVSSNQSGMQGAWHFVATTYNPTTNARMIYLDGKAIALDGPGGNGATNGNFAVGVTNGIEYFTGQLDDLLITNTALSSTQVTMLMNSGIPTLGVSNLLPIASPLTVANNATLDLAGASQQIASLSDYSRGLGGTIMNSSSVVASVLTLSSSNGSSSFSGMIQGGGTLGTISLVMGGSGTQVLVGTNTYTGPTTIDQGKLTIDGWLTSSAVSINGGTLGGTGFLGSVTVNAGGHLAPGDASGASHLTNGPSDGNASDNVAPGTSPGVLHLSGNLGLMAGGVMDFDLDTPLTSDEISMPTGILTFNGQHFSDFDFTWTNGFGPGTYILVNAKSITGLGSDESGSIDGYPSTLSVSNNQLLLTVVPEPSTTILFGAGIVSLLVCARRSRRTSAKV